ncbi:unnamed protein product, partial [Meganyctiphanes norvegica]
MMYKGNRLTPKTAHAEPSLLYRNSGHKGMSLSELAKSVDEQFVSYRRMWAHFRPGVTVLALGGHDLQRQELDSVSPYGSYAIQVKKLIQTFVFNASQNVCEGQRGNFSNYMETKHIFILVAPLRYLIGPLSKGTISLYDMPYQEWCARGVASPQHPINTTRCLPRHARRTWTVCVRPTAPLTLKLLFLFYFSSFFLYK